MALLFQVSSVRLLLSGKVLAACMLLFIILSGAHAEVFRFAPEDGSKSIERTRREIITEVAAGNHRSKEVDIAKSVVERVVRVTDHAIFVTLTETDANRIVDGRPFDNPSQTLLRNKPTTRVFDKERGFLRLEGCDSLIADAKRIFPESQHAFLEVVFSPQVLEQREKDTWMKLEGGRLVGMEVARGGRWENEEDYGEIGKPYKVTTLTRVTDIESSKEALKVTLLTFYTNDRSFLKRVDSESVTSLKDPAVEDYLSWNVGNLPLLKGASLIILDARTLRIMHREQIEIQVMDTPEGLKTRTEHGVSQIEYSRPK
jgi:hypothetical protein